MKIRKSILLLTLMLALSFVLAACGNSNSPVETSFAADETETVPETLQTEEPTEDVSEEPTEEPETAETDANGGNVLIAYFSHTGNTEEAAQMIAEYTGGDLAEIQRAEEYGDLQEEAEAEILDGVHPEISVSVDSIEGYDTIFVGYPIWWGEAPRIVSTFVESYDFSGKTIVPFCTSGGSGIGFSASNLEQLTSGANWLEGQRLNGSDSQDTVMEWVNSLNLNEE